MVGGAAGSVAPTYANGEKSRRFTAAPSASWPGLTRPSLQLPVALDGRVKPGHDGYGMKRRP